MDDNATVPRDLLKRDKAAFDRLVEANERLTEQLAEREREIAFYTTTTDRWRGKCGHEWRKSEDGEQCPRCALKGALGEAAETFEGLLEGSKHCGDPDWECPLHDAYKDDDIAGQLKRLRALLAAGERKEE